VNKMNKFSYKFATGMAAGALLLSAFAPTALADTTVDITGNGHDSTNTVNVEGTQSGGTSVNQTNTTTVITTVNAVSNTGGNTASGNTGGDVTVRTGNATTNVVVDVAGGTNTASDIAPCGCDGDIDVTIARNGADSHNTVNIGTGGEYDCGCLNWLSINTTGNNGSKVKQKNTTTVVSSITAKSKTGKNKANNNTHGTTRVRTGDAATGVVVTVTGSSNDLH
jgi:hypothetical protein